jgi:hypothetical protein
VTDLLHEGRSVGAWHGIAYRKVLEGGCQVELPSTEAGAQELLSLMRSAEERKRRAATAMNERSSRAHAVLIFRLVQREAGEGAGEVESTMCLADLGGSEQVRQCQLHANPCEQNIAYQTELKLYSLHAKPCEYPHKPGGPCAWPGPSRSEGGQWPMGQTSSRAEASRCTRHGIGKVSCTRVLEYMEQLERPASGRQASSMGRPRRYQPRLPTSIPA